MQKKRKIILALLIFGLFLAANKILAADLEVKYPEIAGQTITSTTELPAYVTYLFDAGMIIGYTAVAISIVWAGVLFLLSTAIAKSLSDAKERLSGAITGLIILTLTYLIVTTINPQLNVFKFNKLPEIKNQPTEVARAPGVYFYKTSCPGTASAQPNTSSINDLGDLKNHMNSVEIVQDSKYNNYFISVLFEQVGFWGRCQYINPNAGCQEVTPFANSASVYRFDREPDGEGVYFYRKSCFNNIASNNTDDLVAQCNNINGGYLKISNAEIKTGNGSLYFKKLQDLRFVNVPDSEKECIKYDENGNCKTKAEPTLAGENISSIIVNGNYVVLLVYFDPTKQDQKDVWTSCQEFPLPADVNRLGPQQIKFDQIRNTVVKGSGGVIPNYMVIFPIKP